MWRGHSWPRKACGEYGSRGPLVLLAHRKATATAKAADKSVRATQANTMKTNARSQLAQSSECRSDKLHALSAPGRVSRADRPREAPRLPRLRVLGQACSR